MKNFLIDFMASEVERRTSCDFNILYEDDHCVIFPDIKPGARIHL